MSSERRVPLPGDVSPPFAEWARKALARGSRYNKRTFPDLPRAIFWLRVSVGILTGLLSGLLPLTGWNGFILFGFGAFVLLSLYLGPQFLDVDYTDWSQNELLQEGGMVAFALHMVRVFSGTPPCSGWSSIVLSLTYCGSTGLPVACSFFGARSSRRSTRRLHFLPIRV
jgi:hypothetical protein